MKHILVPTDFSAYSLKALNYAIEMARVGGFKITLLHACDLIDNQFISIKEVIDEQNREIQKELWGKLHLIQQSVLETENLNLELRLYNGDITESIIQEAVKSNADLILMGTLGAAGLKEKILGSKATMVIRHSPVPVLCIPFDYEWDTPKHILLAVNAEPKSTAEFEPLVTFCRLFNASLTIAVFSEDAAESYDVMAHSRVVASVSEKLKEGFPDISVKTAHLSGAQFYDVLLKYIHENEIDLFAMIPHQKKWLQYITGKSMTQKMATHIDVPLLVLNE